MKARLLAVCAALIAQQSFADADWSYSDQTAPQHWASINTKYQACGGLNQSPINIQQTTKATLPALQFNYQSTAKTIEHNGHTVQVDFNEGATLALDGESFALKQFHLHSPSENTIHGKSYPMEMHLVHASEKGELAVVAVMFEQADVANEKLKNIWKALPKKQGERLTAPNELATNFLPEKLDYYRFNGSLTTPPCSEGVRWIVLKDIQLASAQQIAAFSSLMPHANNRPVQPLNARLVLE